jgi:rare lipoprotein A (peptidoglycan hydrolase)
LLIASSFTGSRNIQTVKGGRRIALSRVAASELAMILDGIDVSKLKRVRRYERSARSGHENGDKNRGTKKRKRKQCENKRQFRVCVPL